MIRPNEYISEHTTVGAEFEFEGVAQSAFNGLNTAFRYDLHDDGSTRGPTFTLDGQIAIIPQRCGDRNIVPSGIIPSGNYGMEFVTRPLTIGEALTDAAPMLSEHLKHIKKTDRTSVHLHIDVANRPWTYIRNVIMWSYNLDYLRAVDTTGASAMTIAFVDR